MSTGTTPRTPSSSRRVRRALPRLASALAAGGVKAEVYDVSVTHGRGVLAEAFRCSHAVFAATTYNNGVFVSMENFLHDLKAHAYQNRKYAVVENGSWAPQAGGLMEEMLSSCKNMTRLGEKVTVLSAVNEGSRDALLALAAAIVADFHS